MKVRLLSVVLIVLLGACSAPQNPIEKEIEVTRIVEQTTRVKETVVITQIFEVTSTPIPPSPTLSFDKWSIENAQNAIIKAGLEFESPSEMTKDDYGMAPLTAKKGVRFFIPSLCSDCGGRLFTFSTKEDLESIYRYYDELGKQSAMFFSWVFFKDNVLIQINGDLSEEKALEYQTALDTIAP